MVVLSHNHVGAFPNEVGTCKPGTQALLQATSTLDELKIHLILNQIGTTGLADFNLTMLMDGQIMDPAVPFDFSYGENHTLELQSMNPDNNGFKGFLIRLESTQGDRTFTSLSPIDDTVQESTPCTDASRVGGVSHNEASVKTSVKANLLMDWEAPNLVMDVTVVVATNRVQNISEWYYSQYQLNAVLPPSTPATSDVATPAPVPIVTAAPQEPPTEAPTSTRSIPSSASKHNFMKILAGTTLAILFSRLILG